MPAAPLLSIPLQNPGSKGLNTLDSSNILDVSWAVELDNAVFDNAGRIAARKGWTKLTSSGSPGAHNIEQIHCWEDGINTVVISASNNDIFYGTTTLASKKGALTPTANNWQFLNWDDGTNKKIVAWQKSHAPIVSTVTGTTPGNFAAIVASTGTVPAGNCVMSAWGRLWASDSDNLTIKYSGLLNETQWSSGGAGSFDTRYYWPRNGDFITALATYQDKLVVFGRKNILIYGGTLSPSSSLALVDSVEGVGCVARDSVQSLGNDLIFLSETGLRSLNRTLAVDRGTGSLTPLQEVASQARDTILSYVFGNETAIRSCYNVKEGFYVLAIPNSTQHVVFIIDLKGLKTQGLLGNEQIDIDRARVARWTGWSTYGLAYGRNQVMYGGFADTTDSNNGVIGWYTGYLDNATSYTFSWKSPWIDLGAQDQGESGNFLKIPKEMQIYTVGYAGGTYAVTHGYDFNTIYFANNITIPGNGSATSEWGTPGSEWGLSEYGYSTTFNIEKNKSYMLSSGQVIQIGVSASISSNAFALQRIDIYLKRGRSAR